MAEQDRKLTSKEIFEQLYGGKKRTKDGCYDGCFGQEDDFDDDDADCYCD